MKPLTWRDENDVVGSQSRRGGFGNLVASAHARTGMFLVRTR